MKNIKQKNIKKNSKTIKNNNQKQNNFEQNNFFKNNFEQAHSFFLEQEKKILENQKKQFSFFIIIFVLFYLVFNISIAPLENSFKEFNGKIAESLLSVQGKQVSDNGFYESKYETVYSFFVEGKQIIISGLCSGLLEIIILVSTIIATLGISARKKIVGIIIGIIVGIIFNTMRIWITINVILTQNTQVIEFTHDLLFRTILFIYITGFYVVWFYWAKTKNPNKTINKKQLVKNN